MNRFNMGNMSLQRNAAKALEAVRLHDEKRRFMLNKNAVTEKRKEVKAKIQPEQHARELIGRYGLDLTLEAAWTTFSEATDEDQQKHWKLVGDFTQKLIDKRGY